MINNSLEEYSINLPLLVSIINKWKKKLLTALFILGLVTSIVLFLKPNIYYSYSTAISTNASLSDKAYIFNDKIDGLYSSLGSFSDLDRVYSLVGLDTSYKYLIYTFHLLNHYKIDSSNKNIAIQKAIKYMKEETISVEKTEDGLLRIHVWDENANTAALMANAMMDFVEKESRALQTDYNINSLKKIDSSLESKSKLFKNSQELHDGNFSNAEKVLLQSKATNLLNEINDLQKIKHQFETTIQFQQPSLRVVDSATPNFKHVKPKRIYLLISTMILGFFCMLLFVFIIESVSRIQKKK